MGFLSIVLQFLIGGVKALFGRGGGDKPPLKPADVVSAQAAETPTLAATAARDEQTVADVKAAQTAQEVGNDKLRDAQAARNSVLADSARNGGSGGVQNDASIYADDGFKRRD